MVAVCAGSSIGRTGASNTLRVAGSIPARRTMKKFTVKELREKLEKIPDDYVVEVYHRHSDNTPASNLHYDEESKTIYIT